MAMQGEPASSDLVSKPALHLFGQNTSRVAFRRGAYLRGYVLTFAELLSPRLTRALVERAMNGQGDHYDL
jgi:LysR family cys regulon transcriptional activator